MNAAEAPPPEFARPVAVPQGHDRESVHRITAGEAERAALAERFALVALDRLDAEVRLRSLAGGLVRLSAALSADVVQSCIITLEPVPSRIEERFTQLYGAAADAREIVLDGEAETVEPLAGAMLDIGEAVAQQLSLVLDPFPRAAGARLDPSA